MKKGKIAVLVLLMLSFAIIAHAEQLNLTDAKELDFKEQNNIQTVYLKNGNPFTGAVKLLDDDGRSVTYIYREGRRNGIAVAYYETGKPEIEISYARGMKNGDENVFYINGNPQRKRSYKDNVLHGEEVLYYENGKPQKRLYYRDGKLNDSVVEFDVNGNKTKITPYTDDVKNGVEQIFENDTLHKITYKNGVLEGEDILYYPNGKPHIFKNYKNGKLNGKVMYFDQEGNQTKIENYVDDVKEGLEQVIADNTVREEYNYVNGKLDGVVKFADGKYLTDEINYKDGKKNGTHTTYKQDGSKTVVNYVNDLKSGDAFAYYPNGTVANKVRYLNDQKNGILEKFYETGILSSAESYKNGEKDGISRYFNDSGILTAVSRYENGVEMSKIEIASHPDLKNIYEAYQKGQLSRFSNKKNMWYLILWLGLNSGKADIIETLEKEMSMFSIDISDMDNYKRSVPAKFDEYTDKLYFGLTPLSYAISIGAPNEIVHKFASLANEDNPNGTTALQIAVHSNESDVVKYLLLHKADVSSKNKINKDIVLYALKNGTQNDIVEELLKAGAQVNVSDSQDNTPLSLAIEQQNADLFDILAQNGADLKGLTDNGQTMLFYAYENKVPNSIIDRLIKIGIDVNQKDNAGNVLLVNALANADNEMVKILLSNGADVNEINSKKESAVTYALANKLDDEIETLIFSQKLNLKDNVAKFNMPLWKLLVENNRLDLLKMIWDRTPDAIFEKNSNGEIPFYEALKITDNAALRELVLSYVETADDQMIWSALKTSDLDLLKFMIAHKANVNATDEKGDTLLIYAAKHNMPIEFFEVLETSATNVNRINAEGKDALGIATLDNNVEAVKNLLEHGADVNRKYNGKTYPMMLKNYQSEIADLFMKHNANFKLLADDGTTLLMNAVANLNATLVTALADHDVDFNERDKDGNTALLYLIKALDVYKNMSSEDMAASFRKIISSLVKGGADINAQDFGGDTLLIKLAKMKSPAYQSIRNVMVELGANPDMKDQYGKTAADYE